MAPPYVMRVEEILNKLFSTLVAKTTMAMPMARNIMVLISPDSSPPKRSPATAAMMASTDTANATGPVMEFTNFDNGLSQGIPVDEA